MRTAQPQVMLSYVQAPREHVISHEPVRRSKQRFE